MQDSGIFVEMFRCAQRDNEIRGNFVSRVLNFELLTLNFELPAGLVRQPNRDLGFPLRRVGLVAGIGNIALET